MGASNTPMPDLIELSSINANATFTVTPGGGGDIIGFVDNATYTDSENNNSATEITELNETTDADSGTISIDGTQYNIQLVVPDGSGHDVTVTYDNGASSVDLSGDGGTSQIVIIVASPLGGGSDRFFVAFDDGVGDLPDITSIQFRDLDFDPSGDDVKINLDQNNSVAPVCFTPGTRILTPCGEVAVEDLSIGDLVWTLDAGARPVRWIMRREMSFTAGEDDHKPILIKAGALGYGLPTRGLEVSPQHRILAESRTSLRETGYQQVLTPAKGMTPLRGVRVLRGRRSATYISLLLDRHHVLQAEGALTESFYPGPTALRLLPGTCRKQVLAIFPGLRSNPETGYGLPARPVLTVQQTRHLSLACKHAEDAFQNTTAAGTMSPPPDVHVMPRAIRPVQAA